MYLLQEITSFLHEHGEQSKDQGCLPFCSPRPLYSASQPKSMFFLRATCQYHSGCVKPFFLLHLYAASSSPSNVTAIYPHGFPYETTWQNLFPRSSLILSNFILFLSLFKIEQKSISRERKDSFKVV